MKSSERAALLMALQRVATLAPIREWPPVGALLEEALQAAGGAGSLSMQEIQRLHTWSRRWEALPSELQHFYSQHDSDQRVNAALWHLLGGYPKPTGPAYGRLRSLWNDWHGYVPSTGPFP